MKVLFINILLFISIVLGATEPYRIAIMTDIHYLSPKLMDGGYAVENYMQTSGRMIKYIPTVLDSVFSQLSDNNNNKIQCLLICGDMTKDGERQSHLDFIEKLETLRKKGKQIFVIPGNHDINMPNAKRYEGNKTFPTENISPDEFADIYKDYGFNAAFSRDTASLSYAAVLHKHPAEGETWLIAIDAARYEEYKTSSISAGRIKPETELWIMNILAQAKDKGVRVYGMMHWGAAEHFPMQANLMSNYLVDDWKRIADKFADNGMKYLFTGHGHANDITKHTSPSGNYLYDIETGTLSSYPFTYRIIDDYISEQHIYTHRIEAIPENPLLGEQSKNIIIDVAKKMTVSRLDKIAPNIDQDKKIHLAKLSAILFAMHLHGDEDQFEDYHSIIKELGSDYDMNEFTLDFYPADNNIIISGSDVRIISIP